MSSIEIGLLCVYCNIVLFGNMIRSLVVMVYQAMSVDIKFPVEDFPENPVFLTVPESLAVNTSLVTAHESGNCDSTNSAVAKFDGSFSGNKDYPAVSFFSFNPRPSPLLQNVCIDGTIIGHFVYFSSPLLLPVSHPAFPKQTVEIRQFVNFGWSHRFPDVDCLGCDGSLNTLAFKSAVAGITPCSGRREEHNAFSNISAMDRQPAHLFPFRLNVSRRHDGSSSLQSWTVSTQRLSVYDESLAQLKNPMQICFYSNPMAGSGIYLGTAEFLISENDTSALVFFILFFAIIFPVTCIVVTTLYCYRLKRHRQFVRSVKHFIQGIQLEREMMLIPPQQPDVA